MTHWFISFATDEGFRGATIVAADDDEDAVIEATRRGLNPGGEAAVLMVPSEVEGTEDFNRMLNRLATKEEMLAHGGKRLGDMTEDEREAFESHNASYVCDDCNR